jgi:hypothetical protein
MLAVADHHAVFLEKPESFVVIDQFVLPVLIGR